MNRGRPKKQIDLSRVPALRAIGLNWDEVAMELGVHRNTLQLARVASQIADGKLKRKICGGYCKRRLPVSEFSTDKSRRDGLNIKCRACVSRRWKELYSSPCVDCGNPRRSPTPGQCRRCYRMAALLKQTEFDAIWLIPNLIVEHKQKLMGDLIKNERMRPVDKLLALVERVTNGNQRNIRTQG
jgi:hypothetical protein